MIESSILSEGLKICDRDGRLATVVRVDSQLSLFSLVYDGNEAVMCSGISFERLKDFCAPEDWTLQTQHQVTAASSGQPPQPTEHGIRALITRAMSDPISTRASILSGGLEPPDILLADSWLKREPNSKDRYRMLSARNAEKAVAAYFRDAGYSVSDVAISQLESPHGGEWEAFDIRVGASAVDVKNARCSPVNEKSYVSHCVPRFKEEKRPTHSKCGTHNVRIAGVLSPYLGDETLLRAGEPLLFLGLTEASRLDRLEMMLAEGPLRLALQQSPDSFKILLPPWIFDYPKKEYTERDAALKLIRDGEWRETKSDETISAAVAAAADIEFSPSAPLRDDHMRFVLTLSARIHKYGLSLPVLYLTVLERFLQSLLSQEIVDFIYDDYVSLIFPTSKRTRPLFIFDPLETVHNLLISLSNLWKRRNSELRQMKSFQLRGLNILRGKTDEAADDWKTIMAYCGGVNKKASEAKRYAPCGNTPLILGECDLCKFGRLICPLCEFCCLECKSKKADIESL